MNIKPIILFTLLFPLLACSSAQKRSVAEVAVSFSMPSPPSILTTPEQKAEFVATHYWDNFDFADTTLISRAEITEQAFADFVNILPNLPQQFIDKGVATMLNRASADSAMYAKFVELSEKYLYDPNSPFRNEEVYIVVLRNIVANTKLDDIYKVRARFQLELAMKNRIGNKATDFTYTTQKGGKATLHQATGDPLMLFFFRPDCETCKEVKAYVKGKGIDKRVKILFVNPDIDTHIDTIYDLRASPTLYLLDKEKRVILKDASIEQIEQYLTTQ